MKFKDKHIPFPATSYISFKKIFEQLEEQAQDSDALVAEHAKNLLQDMEPYPVLREGFNDEAVLEKHQPQIDRLVRTLFPDLLLSNEIKIATPPFSFEPLYTSTRFRKIMDNAGTDCIMLMKGFNEESFYIMACATILRKHFNYPIDLSRPLICEIPDKTTGRSRYYRLGLNADMIELHKTDKANDITYEEYLNLVENFNDIELWKSMFPVNSWEFRGIGMLTLTDVTRDQLQANITENLLSTDPDMMDKVMKNITDLMEIPDLRIGFTEYEEMVVSQAHKEIAASMMLGDAKEMDINDLLEGAIYETLFVKREPLVIQNVKYYHKLFPSKFTQNLLDQGVASYLNIPLDYQGTLIAFMEYGSTSKHDLNPAMLNRFEDIIPIFKMAAGRFNEEALNRIEAIIQQECTTIHESVKWRFKDEARKYMQQQDNGQPAKFNDISFNDIYPLYGQLDIRSSSTKRNEAVKTDLITQMKAVKSLLKKAYKTTQLPAIEELAYRVTIYLEEIRDGLLAGSEHKILGFLRSEIYPVLGHLRDTDDDLARAIDKYEKILDENLKMVYKARKDFDQSVTITNERLAAYIDRKQEEAQSMFPHYFERYKTDGLEYNLYIGQSITKSLKYDPLYLSNLRLWQLMVMCEMEREYHHVQKELPTPLEVASLVLVYNTPLSIQFRMDEKRFDVEGAYNARYEIVKKRVDKARIKGTDERITAAGKIAIIYTSEQDVIEYKKFIRFLTNKGLLADEPIEECLLEDLQGITGLKALRVKVNYSEERGEKLSYEEVIETLAQPVE